MILHATDNTMPDGLPVILSADHALVRNLPSLRRNLERGSIALTEA
jgi:hypothetical protein